MRGCMSYSCYLGVSDGSITLICLVSVDPSYFFCCRRRNKCRELENEMEVCPRPEVKNDRSELHNVGSNLRTENDSIPYDMLKLLSYRIIALKVAASYFVPFLPSSLIVNLVLPLPLGCMSMHDGGEVAVRACYTAIPVASVLNILDEELTQGVGNYILSCQPYEGGIAGEPGSEAHGGYTFCGLAAMILINKVDRLDLASLTEEGHDSTSIPVHTVRSNTESPPLYQSHAVQQYVLLCSQMEGGFRDKPGKYKDFYHTCYCLSGLAAAQYSWSKDADSPPLPRSVLGPYSNLLEPINHLHDIVLEKYYEARYYGVCSFSLPWMEYFLFLYCLRTSSRKWASTSDSLKLMHDFAEAFDLELSY
ncbi:protein farnesyltransferase subunit beta [Tanacetum coccineum]